MSLDTATISRFFDGCRHQVYRWALGLSGRHDDALDLTQEAFLRLLRSRPALANEAAAAGWLRQVVCNLALDRLRSERRAPLRATTGSGPTAADDLRGPLERVEAVRADAPDDEQSAALRGALLELSPQQRLVLLCKCYDDMSFARIAAELELSESTVKTHYLRALLTLRERLGESATRGPERTGDLP